MGRRKAPRGRRTKGGVPPSSRSFEASLARGGDSFSLRGKLLTSAFSIGPTPNAIFALTPLNLGPRAAALSAIFARYRFKFIRFKFIGSIQNSTTGASSGIGQIGLGVLDDSSTAEGDAPTTVSGLLECRCSGTNMSTQTVTTEFVWMPVDKSKWYYTYTGATGSDVRFTSPGVLYAGSTVASGAGINTACEIEVDYSVVFSGAVDIGST
jgi:hypothetical protein